MSQIQPNTFLFEPPTWYKPTRDEVTLVTVRKKLDTKQKRGITKMPKSQHKAEAKLVKKNQSRVSQKGLELITKNQLKLT